MDGMNGFSATENVKMYTYTQTCHGSSSFLFSLARLPSCCSVLFARASPRSF